MLRVNQVKIRTGHSEEALRKKISEILKIPGQEIRGWKLIRRSIDARKKPELFYSYTLDVEVKNEERVLHRFQGKDQLVCRAQRTPYHFPKPGGRAQESPTVIVGMGPAGLFCAYFLALHGYRPVLLERGKSVEERSRDVEAFWETGKLNPDSNVQFGEGGAGAFSDGKLNTLVKDKDGRNAAVLETLVKFGADERILYDARPHIGTDVLLHVVKRMREEIIRLGGQVRFESQVTDICIEQGRVTGAVIGGREKIACRQLVLAPGHSARDTFSMLYDRQVPMEAKAFAVGLRVEHPQAMINESQYGMAEPGSLGAAPYKVTARAKKGRGVYSFCMCPGGYVVNASSEEGRTAVNGMSYSARGGENANSAVIVTVTPQDFGSEHPLAGISFQRRLEERAYALGGGNIPVQRYEDFKARVEQAGDVKAKVEQAGDDKAHAEQGGDDEPRGEQNRRQAEPREREACRENSPESLKREESRKGDPEFRGNGEESESGEKRQREFGEVMPQCKGVWQWADVSRILPGECNEAIVDGMEAFARQIEGFNRPDACMSGVESRTSSPVRIIRDDGLQSRIQGLYPCGEGAGYAGGIVSAAMDGIRVAEAIAGTYAPGDA